MTDGIASGPPEVEPGYQGEPPATTGLHYDGRSSELFWLWLKILLLNVVTIGFYRFWGRTRIRRYLWNHVSLLGDRFEYDGTGGELFVRFLIAIAILLPLIFLAQFAVLLGLGTVAVVLVQILAVGILVFLSIVAYYGSYRYRLSRTVWRGMRGGLDGSSAGFALRVLGFAPLIPLTLYLYLPWWLVRQWNYVINHAGFGNAMFRAAAAGKELFRPFLVAYFAGLVTFAAFAGLAVAMIPIYLPVFHRIQQHQPGAETELVGFVLNVAGAYMLLLIGGLACGIYFYARTMSYMTSSTSFGGVKLSAEVRAWPLFRLLFGNMLIMLPTLGLGAPFAAQRYIRFICRRLVLHNAAELELLSQDPGRRQRRGGEGLLQLLDSGGLT